MIDIPQSTEGLTKLLRSKSITTSQIVEITSRFDELDLYFPNKEIFILELIGDRWNDQKLIQFKQDYKIWRLYNDIFSSLTDHTIQIKLLRDLKFVPHLLKSLDLVDSSLPEFLEELKRTCALINSLIRIEVSSENGITILGKILRLILQTDYAHEDLIYQTVHLTDISNFAAVSTKTSSCYCNELLLPTIKYFVKFGSRLPILSELLAKFLFDPSIDPVKQLGLFIENNQTRLDPEDCILIFEKSLHFLSKEHFLKLESIFSIMTNIQKQLAPILLEKLSISKKKLSQAFLEKLFDKTLENPIYDARFWSLILHILDLDVEIGIKHTAELIQLISERRNVDSNFSEKVWAKIIQCFVNAREFPVFLERIQAYCGNDENNATFLLKEPIYANQISSNVVVLSITQLKTILSDLINEILNISLAKEEFALILKIILKGLPRLSYISLPELKPVVAKVFDVSADHPSKLWEIWYLAMEIYDDIIPLESLLSIDYQLSSFLSLKIKPKELFYYFFKLREYKDYDLLPLVDELLLFLRESETDLKKIVLKDLFMKWHSLMNFVFPQEALDFLTTSLTSEANIGLLDAIFEDDSVFEEPKLMFSLVHKLSESLERQSALMCVVKIPIQCINKSTRITVLNKLSAKDKVTKLDTILMGHLLNNPTFKSTIESNVANSYQVLLHTEAHLEYDNIAIEKVWNNHLNQVKESSSVVFIRDGMNFISEGMEKYPDDMIYFQLAYLALKVCDSNVLDNLKKDFVENCLKKLSSFSIQNASLLTWIMEVLYHTFRVDRNCIPLGNSILQNILEVQKSMKLKEAGEEKELRTSMFLLYSVIQQDKLEYLYAHYMVLRNEGIESEKILPAVEYSMNMSSVAQFNVSFAKIILSLADRDLLFSKAILELYGMQIKHLTKDNIVGTRFFVKSVSEFYTNCGNFGNESSQVLYVLETIQSLLVTKQWLFSQYCIEMLFPMCLKLVLIFAKKSDAKNAIFVSTTKLISNILLAHGVKLSNRHHLINTFLCVYIELLADQKNTGFSSQCAKSLSRLINNFVEPGSNANNHNSKKNTLSSAVALQKKLLRKYAPLLLIKYIHLSINSPFQASTKTELVTSMYSIFDLISQAELNTINGILDNAGRQYFRNLYADYKRVGKWDST